MKTTSIKLFWNGLKVNGEKTLRKCYFSLSDDYIMIYSKGYGDGLPGDVFAVENDTDYYTDYFDDDKARVTPAHPLYKYVRAAALKGEIRSIEKNLPYCDKRAAGGYCSDFYRKEAEDRRARLEKYRAELETLPKGQPTAADLAAVEAMNLAAETARLEAEKKAEQERREKYLAAHVNGRDFITRTMEAHPIRDGEPIVCIQWSEAPAFASWNDNELEMSVAAAEIVLAKYDAEKAAENGGYDKTSFRIEWTDENGETCTYEGRYDLGDNEGGLIAHLRSFAECGWIKDEAERDSYKATADFLAGFIAPQEAAPVVVGVTVAPWFAAAVEAKKARQEAEKEAAAAAALLEAEEQTRAIYEAVELLTDDQLADAIKGLRADNETELTAARFFMQELYKRDEARALRVFHEWRTGKTPSGTGAA